MNSDTLPSPPHAPPAPDTHDDFIAVCQRLAGFDERWDAEWADGLLTALATSAQPPTLDAVLSQLAGEAFERCFADPDDAAHARGVLQRHWQGIATALDATAMFDDPDRLRLTPLILEASPADDGAAAEPTGTALPGSYWAQGFHDALQHFGACWPQEIDESAAQALEAGLKTIAALASADGPRGADQRIDAAAFAAQDLRLLWLEQAVRTPPRQVTAPPGRNDPCPCGSGRKYKKCHGAQA